jgi:drug/metabolite transporter (DMT)-like permease
MEMFSRIEYKAFLADILGKLGQAINSVNFTDRWYKRASMKPPKLFLGHLAAFFTILVWGVTFISIKILLVTFTPVEILFYRLVLAVGVLTALSQPRLTKTKLDIQWLRSEWKLMAAGLCGVTLFFLFQNIALSYTLAANVSVLISVAPLFTALVSRLFLNEKLKANYFLGFAAAITGIILIAFNGSLVLKLNPLGDLLSVLAALVWAFYSVLVKKISSQQTSLLAVTARVFFYGFLFLLPTLPLFNFHLGLLRLASLSSLFNLIFLGIVASAMCFFTWNYAVDLLGPVKTSVYIYIVPIVTVIASILILDEKITPVSGIGIGLILIGMVLSEREKVPGRLV